MALSATHAKRDAIVLHASRGFASAPNSPRVFLQSSSSAESSRRIGRAVPLDTTPAFRPPNADSIEDTLARICSMFPTAREYDVRELLAKYHYREAVVISALQVLKHPIRTPGPSAVATPNKGRRYPAYHLTQAAWSETATITEMNWMSDGRQSKLTGGFSTLSNTPLGSPSANRPHHSPKIKLKYLKSVFPKAEETYLLDLLSSADNNVNQVTQQLLTSGYQKKEQPEPLTPRRSLMTPSTQSIISRNEPTKMEVPSPKRKFRSLAEKLIVKSELEKLFPDEAEAVIQLAMESADFDLDTATTILSNSQKESSPPLYSSPVCTSTAMKHTMTLSSLKTSPSIFSTLKDIATLYSPMRDPDDFPDMNRRKPKHFPAEIDSSFSTERRGPDDSLLKEHYVTARGPCRALVDGPNKSLLTARISKRVERSSVTTERVKVQGPNPQLRRGPTVKTLGNVFSALLSTRGGKQQDPVMRHI